MRRLVPLVLAGLLVLTAVAGLALSTRPAAITPGATTAAAAPAGTRALRVLHGWDRRRARAWADGASRRLRALYAAGSEAGATDRAMLAAYRDRGLRVLDMRRQVLAVRVLRATPGRLTVRVTDRLVGAVAVGRGTSRRLPSGEFSTCTLTFRRADGRWILAG